MLTYPDSSGSSGEASPLAEPLAERVRPVNVVEPAALDPATPECEEMLIVDHRANLGPAQWVEHKLSLLLGGGLLPVSHVRMLTQLGRRSHC